MYLFDVSCYVCFEAENPTAAGDITLVVSIVLLAMATIRRSVDHILRRDDGDRDLLEVTASRKGR